MNTNEKLHAALIRSFFMLGLITICLLLSGVTTVKAEEGDVYNITYKDVGGADFSGEHEDGYPTTHTYGVDTTLKSASKEGYRFDGWYGTNNPNPIQELGKWGYTSDITLYAKWSQYDVQVDFNGSTTLLSGLQETNTYLKNNCTTTAEKKATVTLLDNVILENYSFDVQEDYVNLELNGKTITIAGSGQINVGVIFTNDPPSYLEIKDSVGGGKVTCDGDFKIQIQDTGTLVLTSGTIDGIEMSSGGSYTQNGGTCGTIDTKRSVSDKSIKTNIIINGGTISTEGVAFDNGIYNENKSITINGGTIICNTVITEDKYENNNYNLCLYGGNFTTTATDAAISTLATIRLKNAPTFSKPASAKPINCKDKFCDDGYTGTALSINFEVIYTNLIKDGKDNFDKYTCTFDGPYGGDCLCEALVSEESNDILCHTYIWMKYNPGSGSGTATTVKGDYHKIYNILSDNYFTRDGYEQVGWSLYRESTNPSDAITSLSAATMTATQEEEFTKNLYPVWKKKTYTVQYKKGTYGEGDEPADKQYESDYKWSIILNNTPYFTREGYIQTGWSETDGGEKVDYRYISNINRNYTFYPVWSLKHDVTYKTVINREVSNAIVIGDSANTSTYILDEEDPSLNIDLSELIPSRYVATGIYNDSACTTVFKYEDDNYNFTSEYTVYIDITPFCDLTGEADGSDRKPYIISTEEQMNAFIMGYADFGSESLTCIKLNNDLTLTASNENSNYCKGYGDIISNIMLDGNGHKITLNGLYNSYKQSYGLFPAANMCIVSDLDLAVNATVETVEDEEDIAVGGLVGIGGAILARNVNVSMDATVTGPKVNAFQYIGGLCGEVEGAAIISDCTTSGNINVQSSVTGSVQEEFFVGGFVGLGYGSCYFVNDLAKVDFTATDVKATYGGIACGVQTEGSPNVVINCGAIGKVKKVQTEGCPNFAVNTGGIYGIVDQFDKINNSYALLTGENTDCVAGLVYKITDPDGLDVSNSYSYASTVASDTDVEGIVVTSEDVKSLPMFEKLNEKLTEAENALTETGVKGFGFGLDTLVIKTWYPVTDTFYPEFTKTYKVTYSAPDKSSGEAPDINYYAEGANFAVEGANTAARTNYNLTAWNDGTNDLTFGTIYTMPASNLILYAKWTPKAPDTYTVIFNVNGHGTVPAQLTGIASGETVLPPEEPTCEGYTFGGWFKEAACTNAWNFASDTVTDNITIYAKWTENAPSTYTVTFEVQGHGTAPTAQNVTSGSLATEPTVPTCDGYTFGGWYKESGCTTVWDFGTDTITDNIRIYAKWTSNGGNGGNQGSGDNGGAGQGTGTIPTNPGVPNLYTVPVTADSTVQINTEITDKTAVLHEITSKQINKVITSNNQSKAPATTITIDVAGAENKVAEVKFTDKTLDNLLNTVKDSTNAIDTITVKTSEATIELDKKTLEAVEKQITGITLSIVVEKTAETKLSTLQQDSLSKHKVEQTFEAYFESNGQRIGDFQGGNVTVAINFDIPVGNTADHYFVYYVADNGEMTKYATKYVNNAFMFTTNHFSDYAIIYDETANNDTVEDDIIDQSGLTGNEIAKLNNLDLLLAKGTGYTKSIKLTWLAVDGATKYEVYWSYCNGKNDFTKLTTTSQLYSTHWSISSNKSYKYFVVAYKMIDGKKVYLARTPQIHVAMKNSKYTNVKSIHIKSSNISLSVKKSYTLAPKAIRENSKKLDLIHANMFRYYSTDKSIATVNSKGKITAKKAGTCYVYIFANNGVYKRIKVTVK